MSYLARHGRQLWDHHELPTFMAQTSLESDGRISSLPFSNANRYFHFADPLSLSKQGAAPNYPRRTSGVLVLLASGRACPWSYLEKLTNRQVDGIASGWWARRRQSEAEPEISINLLFSSLLIRFACWSEDIDKLFCWERQLKTFLAYRNYRFRQPVGFQRKSSL